MKVKSIVSCGVTMNYPAGCHEVLIEFETTQSNPNFGQGWGLGDFGRCKTYQGINSDDLTGFKGVVAYYDGRPCLEVNQ